MDLRQQTAKMGLGGQKIINMSLCPIETVICLVTVLYKHRLMRHRNNSLSPQEKNSIIQKLNLHFGSQSNFQTTDVCINSTDI